MFFVSLFLGCFCVQRVFTSFEGASIVHRWGSSNGAIGNFWDISRFRVIPLGPIKILGSGFLGLVINGWSNLQRGISLIPLGF